MPESCSFCGGVMTANQEKTSTGLYGKPVCTKDECMAKAKKEADEAAESLMTPHGRAIAWLARHDFEEQSVKGFWLHKDTIVAVDLDKLSDEFPGLPQVGRLEINGTITETGHGLSRVDDVRQGLEGVLKPKGAGQKNGKKETPAPKPEPKPEPKGGDVVVSEARTPPGHARAGLLDLIKSYVGNDVLEVFGDSGTGKSKLALELARQAIESGKTVFYLDTERNLTEKDIEMLNGCQYKYTPVIEEIGQISRKLPKVDLIIIDSIGFPVLTAYARMSMKQKGDALLNLIAIFGDLKEWAYRNNGVAVVINQPESEFNKEQGHLLRPFGDKSQFAAKEIWKTEIVQRGKVTKTVINAFRSRSLGHGTKIADMEVSDKGVIIKQAQEVAK